MEAQMTLQTNEPLVVESPALTYENKIFLPFVIMPKYPLLVVTENTYGKPMRYFSSVNDPTFNTYAPYLTKKKIQTTQAESISFGERFHWDVHYAVFKPDQNYAYIFDPANNANGGSGYSINSAPISRIEDVLNLSAPAELKLAILNVAFKELSKD